jgi:Flp pilus assembly CpaF family ATPase
MINQENNTQEIIKQQNVVQTEEQSKKEQEKEAKKTAETLKKDLVEIKIPIDPLNKTDKVVDVIINGYRWTIERGKEVKVPRAVKELLTDANYI